MFKFWGSQEQADPRPQEVSTNSLYPPPGVSSPSSSRPTTPNSSNSNSFMQSPEEQPQSLYHISPAEAAGIIVYLKDKRYLIQEFDQLLKFAINQKVLAPKDPTQDLNHGNCVDELRKLLSDKEAYQQFLLSIDLVKTLNNLRDELRNETLQLARENLAKESYMTELRNQCMIIRTTELAAAEEKLNELNKQKAEILKSYSPASLLHQLQESMNETDEESETLHKQLLEKEIDLATFIQKYKKLRVAYHKRALTHLAAKTCLTG